MRRGRFEDADLAKRPQHEGVFRLSNLILPLSSSAVIQRVDTVVDASIDGEIVALDVEKGVCYGLNRIGSRIWELIASPLRIADLCVQLTSEFDVDPAICERQTVDLLEEMRAEGLVLVREPIDQTP